MLVTLREAAERLRHREIHITTAALRRASHRYPNFPTPVGWMGPGHPRLYNLAEIEGWIRWRDATRPSERGFKLEGGAGKDVAGRH